MVEPQISKQTAGPKWRNLPLAAVMVVSAVAFYWGVDGVDVRRGDYPAIAIARDVSMWTFVAVFAVWFVAALLEHVREWRMPLAEFQRSKAAGPTGDAPGSRFRLALLKLISVLWIGPLFLMFLPDVLFLVDHQSWTKVLAVAPFMLVVMPYLALSIIRALVLDWRRSAPH